MQQTFRVLPQEQAGAECSHLRPAFKFDPTSVDSIYKIGKRPTVWRLFGQVPYAPVPSARY